MDNELCPQCGAPFLGKMHAHNVQGEMLTFEPTPTADPLHAAQLRVRALESLLRRLGAIFWHDRVDGGDIATTRRMLKEAGFLNPMGEDSEDD